MKLTNKQTGGLYSLRAGPRGLEPRSMVLETIVLPLNYRPLNKDSYILTQQTSRENSKIKQKPRILLLGFDMKSVLFAPLTIFLELNFALNLLLVFTRPVINPLAGLTT